MQHAPTSYLVPSVLLYYGSRLLHCILGTNSIIQTEKVISITKMATMALTSRETYRGTGLYTLRLPKKFKLGGGGRDVLDKPYAHRLVDLCVHTVPILSHVLLVSGVELEMVQRFVRKRLGSNRNHSSQISVVDTALKRAVALVYTRIILHGCTGLQRNDMHRR